MDAIIEKFESKQKLNSEVTAGKRVKTAQRRQAESLRNLHELRTVGHCKVNCYFETADGDNKSTEDSRSESDGSDRRKSCKQIETTTNEPKIREMSKIPHSEERGAKDLLRDILISSSHEQNGTPICAFSREDDDMPMRGEELTKAIEKTSWL
jgi:hypothetical protein